MTWPMDVFEAALSDVNHILLLNAGADTSKEDFVREAKRAREQTAAKKSTMNFWWN